MYGGSLTDSEGGNVTQSAQHEASNYRPIILASMYPQPVYNHPFIQIPTPSNMQASSQRPRDHNSALLSASIDVLKLAKKVCSITPAKPAFGVVIEILTAIKVRFLLFFCCGLLVYTSPGVDE